MNKKTGQAGEPGGSRESRKLFKPKKRSLNQQNDGAEIDHLFYGKLLCGLKAQWV